MNNSSFDNTLKAAGEPIAIVGIGCRFPGGADSPERFWKLLRDGIDAIGEIPAGRFDSESYFNPPSDLPGKIVTQQGGFLQDIDLFDADFFGISPREAMAMDPQQRLLLETAWEALEDAGQPQSRVAGGRTGVFVGLWTSDYEGRMANWTDDIDLYVTTGSGRYAASGRISYALDLRGPSLTVDTACSSSLVATHLACESLRAGESDLALSGGVNILLQPHISIGYSRSGILSPDGRCRFGDARASGYVRSEGCGVVALRRLRDAVADGDDIYALILGSATNNDGQGSGLLVQPAIDGQTTLLREAYSRAGVDPAAVRYVEAHGTGTQAGDPVELTALSTVLGASRSKERPFSVGSVKTNIGHTEAASGVAGIIKVALALKYSAIPASLHFSTPNPSIPWDQLPLQMQQAYGRWPDGDGPLIAGVNSFGITGTNAHVVLQEPPKQSVSQTAQQREDPTIFLPLSAHDTAALTDTASTFGRYIEQESPALVDLCYTAGARRTHLPERLGLVASSSTEIAAGLDAFRNHKPYPGLHHRRITDSPFRLAFVFSGQGSQWEQMAAGLIEREPAFRAALEQCDVAIRKETGWSVLEELSATSNRLEEIDVVQPVLFAIQVALAALWQSWGIKPDAVVGSSMGEVAAAYVADALTLEDAVAIICRRSSLLRRIRGHGAMAVVELGVDDARAALAGFEDVLSIGVSNSPRSTVLSGDPEALGTVLELLETDGVFCRLVKVDVASHSPQVEPLLDDLHVALSGVHPDSTDATFYSTVEANPIDGKCLNADYWVRNLRQPVGFSAAVEQLAADGVTAFIEISPHPVLVPAIQQTLQHIDAQALVLPSLRRGEPELATLLDSLGALYVHGAEINWSAIAPGGRHIHLPTYPWQREQFWFDESQPVSRHAAFHAGGHPLLGRPISLAGQGNLKRWETSLDVHIQSFLADHRVGDSVVVPAAAFAELILRAAAETLGTERLSIDGLTIDEALILLPESGQLIQTVTTRSGQHLVTEIFSGERCSNGDSSWTLHASATVRQRPDNSRSQAVCPEQIKARLSIVASAKDHYAAMGRRGLNYGPAFQSVIQTWSNDNGEVLGALRPLLSEDRSRHQDQIALVDGMLQVAVASVPPTTPGTFVPTCIQSLAIHRVPAREEPIWAHTTTRQEARYGDESYVVDVQLLAADGTVLTEVHRLQLENLDRTDLQQLDDLLYQINWHEQGRDGSDDRPCGDWLVLANQSESEEITARILDRGGRCVLVVPGAETKRLNSDHYTLNVAYVEDMKKILNEAFVASEAPRGILYAWPSTENVVSAEEYVWEVINVVRVVAGAEWSEPPRLWLVTRNAQPAGGAEVDARQSPIWGAGRVIANEHPELRCSLLDLGSDDEPVALCTEVLSDSDETQVAIRGSRRFVARLAPLDVRNEPHIHSRRSLEPRQPYRIEVTRPGFLDSIGPRPASRRAPGPGEVEIQVEAAGINFIDVMKAMGICPGFEPRPDAALGGECAGEIVSVGVDVTDLAVGDAVIVFTPSFQSTACLSSFITVPAELVASRPEFLGAEEAAGQLLAYMTAYYALYELGRLRPGERVLIHAATGGVGLAAVNVARRAGAEIFATAGTSKKRDMLSELGIRHVYDSRTVDFAEQILIDTDGYGVDLILNSLTGEAIEANLRTLAPGGRFVEIGKRDIYDDSQIGLGPFRKNLSYFALDLARLVEENQSLVATLFLDVVQLLTAHELPPLPISTYNVAAVSDAFRLMAQGQHTGKLVIRLASERVEIVPTGAFTVRSDSSYLITGGLGALGLETARWLAARGARHLVLLGRSSPSPHAQRVIEQLESAGVCTLILCADVANCADMEEVIGAIDATCPPLRGVFHLAGLLADATLSNVDRSQVDDVFAPKVDGAWNLHRLTVDKPLDYFVLFSSIASVLGLPGQANYAAANAYLDAVVYQRQRTGLPALSVNWAPWANVGMAAEQGNRGSRLEAQGLPSLEPGRGFAALEHLLDQSVPEAIVMRLDHQQWAESNPIASSRFFEFVHGVGTEADSITWRDEMLCTPLDQRLSALEEFVREQLAQVLRQSPDRLGTRTPLKSLGLDSLMTLEFRNRLEAATDLALSGTFVWSYPTIAAIAEYLATRLDIPVDNPDSPVELSSVEQQEELGSLSTEQLERMVDEELEAISKILESS